MDNKALPTMLKVLTDKSSALLQHRTASFALWL